ncbi:MAG TPA: SRPBCC domain-containing protein [Pseudomonadales bacterium]
MGLTIGPLHVRRSVLIEAPPSRVWREFESSDRLTAWLDIGHVVHRLVPEVGSEVEMSVDIDGVARHFGGRVLVVDPERELSFESQWRAPHSWTVPTFWTIRLSALYEGTLVELFHHGFERLGASAADNLEGYEEGWGVRHLKALRAIVLGRGGVP